MYFYPLEAGLEDPDDNRFDMGNKHEFVEDVDPQSLINLLKFLKRERLLRRALLLSIYCLCYLNLERAPQNDIYLN